MKNIHLLPTDKPSRLHFDSELFVSPKYQLSSSINSIVQGRHLYITSDEEIKEGDWVLYGFNLETIYEGGKDWKFTESDIIKCISLSDKGVLLHKKGSTDKELCKKIILTTDPDLIADGVQAIDDEFLEWFVQNPSCKNVEVKPLLSNNGRAFFGYKIIIPQEEPKQETLEEMAQEYFENNIFCDGITEFEHSIAIRSYIAGAKWQAEQDKNKYSEEEVIELLQTFNDVCNLTNKPHQIKNFFEQFKKK